MLFDHDAGKHDSHAHEGDEMLDVTLNEETVAHLETRAYAAGRTLNAQLCYELAVNHGLCAPDPGDVEATQRGQVFRRMFQGRILQG